MNATICRTSKVRGLADVLHQFVSAIALIVCFGIPVQSDAYDNTRNPPFQPAITGRYFGNVSVHPDGEHWLITESVEKTKGIATSIVWLYHLPTRTMKRYELPDAYQYAFARYSPSGRHIVMTRYPKPAIAGEPAFRASIAQGEIVMMNADGTDFKVLPIPKGKIFSPVMSPDERRIAYWLSTKDRPPGERTLMGNFELHEFDRDTEMSRRFSRSFSFYGFRTLGYVSADEIMMGADGLLLEKNKSLSFGSIFESKIYFVKRERSEKIQHFHSDFKFANSPVSDSLGNIYYEADVDGVGISIVKQSPERFTSIWRVPRDAVNIYDICVEPGGKYLTIIYLLKSTNGLRANKDAGKSIAIFDVKKEMWVDVALPALETAGGIRAVGKESFYQ